MRIKDLLEEAALARPGVGMPVDVAQMSYVGWVRQIDEFVEADDTAWGTWFLLLYHFLRDTPEIMEDLGDVPIVVGSWLSRSAPLPRAPRR